MDSYSGPFVKLPPNEDLPLLNKSILKGRIDERVNILIAEQEIPNTYSSRQKDNEIFEGSEDLESMYNTQELESGIISAKRISHRYFENQKKPVHHHSQSTNPNFNKKVSTYNNNLEKLSNRSRKITSRSRKKSVKNNHHSNSVYTPIGSFYENTKIVTPSLVDSNVFYNTNTNLNSKKYGKTSSEAISGNNNYESTKIKINPKIFNSIYTVRAI